MIDPVTQRNWYFDAAENNNLSVLCDERNHTREAGLRWLLKASAENRGGVTKFIVSKVSFDAKDYIDMTPVISIFIIIL